MVKVHRFQSPEYPVPFVEMNLNPSPTKHRRPSGSDPREAENSEMAARTCHNCPEMINMARVVDRVRDGGNIPSNDGNSV